MGSEKIIFVVTQVLYEKYEGVLMRKHHFFENEDHANIFITKNTLRNYGHTRSEDGEVWHLVGKDGVFLEYLILSTAEVHEGNIPMFTSLM